MILLPLLLAAALPAQKAKPAARPAAPSPDSPAILGPGRYYQKDVPALDGEWWALCKTAKGWELRKATLTTEPIAMAGDTKGRRSGLEVGVKGDEATLLLRKVPGVAAFRSVVEASGMAASGETREDQKATGTFGGTAFTVWSEAATVGRAPGYVVKLEQGGREQVLFLNPLVEGGGWELMWAGDLDGDGRLDLLVGTTDPDDFGTLRLYLSGAAGPGQLLKLVASQRWVFGE